MITGITSARPWLGSSPLLRERVLVLGAGDAGVDMVVVVVMVVGWGRGRSRYTLYLGEQGMRWEMSLLWSFWFCIY